VLEDYNLLITQVVTLLAVLDPIGHTTLFLGATSGLSHSDRRHTALVGVGVAYALLSVFGLIGQTILKAMGVSLLSFQIAGGAILFFFAINMVLGSAQKEADEKQTLSNVAIYPVATPIIAGPGSLLTVLLLMNNHRETPMQHVITLAALALVMAVLLVAFIISGSIHRLIGASGAEVLRRVMGLILAALAVNMVLSALAIWLHLPPI